MLGQEKKNSGLDGVRSLERGLQLLRAINESPHATVAELGRSVGLPRSTVYRLLETLEAAGYLGRREGHAGFHLTREVLKLSAGFLDDEWLDATWPELLSLGSVLLWPLSLFTFETGTMVIRRTTHERSAMSIDYGMTGRRMPITASAAGRTYLAFSPPQEREWLMKLPELASIAAQPAELELFNRELDRIVRDGFGTRIGGLMPKTSSLSVPVMRAGKVLCCISVVWIKSAMSLERALAELSTPMLLAAQRMQAIADTLR